MSRLRLARRAVVAVFFGLLGSASIIIAADHFRFMRGDWNGWQVDLSVATHDDAIWWQSRLGPRPPSRNDATFVAPATIQGRRFWNNDGYEAPENGAVAYGLNAYRIRSDGAGIRGSILVSPERHAWHMYFPLPCGPAIERFCFVTPGQQPPDPTIGGWEMRLLLGGLLLNSLLLAIPLVGIGIAIVSVSKSVRATALRTVRRRHSQCAECLHPLQADQRVCPECGVRVNASLLGADVRRRPELLRRCAWIGSVLLLSAAIVLLADLFLFSQSVGSGWKLNAYAPDAEDEKWWLSHVGGSIESRRDTTEEPQTIFLMNGPTPAPVGAGGLRGFEIEPVAKRLRGKLLFSSVRSAWRVSIDLPGGSVVERSFVMLPGQTPTVPSLFEWTPRISPLGFLLNSALVAALLGGLSAAGWRVGSRIKRGSACSLWTSDRA
jgi:hypothetical protein